MVLEVVLVVLELTGPQVPWVIFQTRLSLRPDLYSPAPPIGNIKLQTTCFRNVGKLQTRDLVENDRLDVLYLLRAKSPGSKRN